MQEQGIKPDFIETGKEVRTNLKVVEADGYVTEFNEPGPVNTAEEQEALIQKLLSYADRDALFVLAGSIPNGMGPDIIKPNRHELEEYFHKDFPVEEELLH